MSSFENWSVLPNKIDDQQVLSPEEAIVAMKEAVLAGEPFQIVFVPQTPEAMVKAVDTLVTNGINPKLINSSELKT